MTPTMKAPTSGTILLVEDDEPLARSLTRIISAGGYDVVHANTGEAAIATIRTRSFHAVLSDLNLPGRGGVEVLAAARASDPDVPLLLMTGAPTSASEFAAVQLGIDGYLVKPTSTATLTRLLHRVSRTRRSSATVPPPPDYGPLVDRSAQPES